jgi:hypothetical protein
MICRARTSALANHEALLNYLTTFLFFVVDTAPSWY